jgi:hypothetical protein
MNNAMRDARAVRNNNPGNLEGGPRWKGLLPRSRMSAEQKRERRFAVFASPMWGFRALGLVLRNYQRRYGLDTVRKIIARFAPPGENDTASYVRAVARGMRISADALLDLKDSQTLAALCKAIAVHESGGWFFSDADLRSGIALALAA